MTNVLFLFIRMVITVPISLYISRIVLDLLGASDYGLYNLVAGFVMMFSFLSASMSSAIQRFMSYEIGKKSNISLNQVFSIVFKIHVLLATLMSLVLFVVGFWFIENKLSIPVERLDVAKKIFIISNVSFFINILIVPFNALIFSHEKMKVYSFVTTFQVLLKLAVALLLSYITFDLLLSYSLLLLLVSLITNVIIVYYCFRNIKINYFYSYWNSDKFKEILSYASWNVYGNVSAIAKNQGSAVILNIFFGTIINASYAISMQVSNAIKGIVNNFQVALYPPIVKAHASGEDEYYKKLMFFGSKLSFVLLFVVVLPLFMEMEYVISLWLKNVPEGAVVFSKLLLLNLLLDSFGGIIASGVQATGKIKVYQIVVSTLNILPIIIAYILFYFDFSADSLFYSIIVFSFISMFTRVYILSKVNDVISFYEYVKTVIFPVFMVIMFSGIITQLCLRQFDSSFLRLLLMCFLSLISIASACLLILFDKNEISKIKPLIMKFQKKITNN
ncbi:MATE family efflux transporter [Tenacibaculum salmonis]|uniref:hypothetical protein n=1 Tax=Tenacibaculum sp. P3-BQ1 TaxID=3232310 RepID=UPI0034E03F1E